MYNTERVLLLNESQLGLPWISQVLSVRPNKLLLKHYANEKEYKKVLQCHSKITSKVFYDCSLISYPGRLFHE